MCLFFYSCRHRPLPGSWPSWLYRHKKNYKAQSHKQKASPAFGWFPSSSVCLFPFVSSDVGEERDSFGETLRDVRPADRARDPLAWVAADPFLMILMKVDGLWDLTHCILSVMCAGQPCLTESYGLLHECHGLYITTLVLVGKEQSLSASCSKAVQADACSCRKNYALCHAAVPWRTKQSRGEGKLKRALCWIFHLEFSLPIQWKDMQKCALL